MAQDALQIALEHHRAGRYRQAEAGYRALLQNDPDHAEAAHWLGVLAFQAGRADQAIPLLERAAELRPADASYWHNLGQAYLASGQSEEAVAAFERAGEIEPGRGETLLGIGLALLARKGAKDAEAAIAALRRARDAGLDSAELNHELAVGLLAAGQHEEAIEACKAALQKRGEYPGAYFQMAMAHRARGQTNEVRKCLLKAVELEPELAEAWYALAVLDAEAGKHGIAAGLFRRAIRARPGYAAAYRGLGRALELAGQAQDAMDAFAQALRFSQTTSEAPFTPPLPEAVAELEERLADPAITDLHYAFASQYNIFPPARIPAALVTSLFDRYAETFDKHLTGRLRYNAPELIAAKMAAMKAPTKMLDVLDLGCGTGLCGAMLRPMAGKLVGVDLSPAMIEKARARGVYDQLTVGDLVEALRNASRSWDLVVAADVLIYLGDLSPTFEAAAQALRPGGMLAFTTEAGTGDRYDLQLKTRRFRHSRPYIEHLAEIHGFREEIFEPIIPRYEGEQPVEGFLVMLRWPGQ